MTNPDSASMIAPSAGSVTNSNSPPAKPKISAIPPSHVGVNSNEESSDSNVVISTVVAVGHKFVVSSSDDPLVV